MGFSQDLKSKKKIENPAFKKETTSTQKKDSIDYDKRELLAFKQKDTIAVDSLKSKETIEDIILHVAKDYTIQNAKDKTVKLYNEARITYTDIDLKAGIIIIDYKKNTLFAKGIKDSTS